MVAYFTLKEKMEWACKICDNYERHQEECQWCEYETGMVHPSRFQPILGEPSFKRGDTEQMKGNLIKGVGRFEKLGKDIGEFVDEKNQAYGDSANTSAEAFKLLYPDGIKVEQYEDALLLVRIWDKMKRIATKKDAFGESPYRDIAGYSLLGAMKDERE